MASLSDILRTPQAVTLGGVVRMATPLSLRDFAALESWVNAARPDPLEMVRRHVAAGGVPMEHAKYLYAEALKVARRDRVRVLTDEFTAELSTPAGLAKLLHASLSKADPAFSEDDGWNLAAAMLARPDEIEAFMAVCQAALMMPAGGDNGPKAPPPTSATSGT